MVIPGPSPPALGRGPISSIAPASPSACKCHVCTAQSLELTASTLDVNAVSIDTEKYMGHSTQRMPAVPGGRDSTRVAALSWALRGRLRVVLVTIGLLLALDVGRSLWARVGYARPVEEWQPDT